MLRPFHRLSYSPACQPACVLLLLALAAGAPLEQHAAASGASPSSAEARPSLARCIPGDAAIYFEISTWHPLAGSRPSGMVSAILETLKMPVASGPAESAPASSGGLRQLFTAAVGLTQPRAIQILFSGPIAVAADGWSGLSDAILMARPADPAALEQMLAEQQLGGAESQKIRRYVLGNGHELACDGRIAVIGRMKRTSLYARTLELLGGSDLKSLADNSEFRERTSCLSPDAQIVAYIGKSSVVTGEGQNPLSAWWPENWPWIRTVALGLVWGRQGAQVQVSARLDLDGPPLVRSEPPIRILRRLPVSTLAAWTHSVDFIGQYRRLRGRLSHDPDGFHFDSLEQGLEPGIIEENVLSHLVGDTILLIDQVAVRPNEASDPHERLVLPVVAMLVETDDPDAVAGTLPLLGANLVQLLNQQAPSEQAIAVREEHLSKGGPILYSIPMGLPRNGKTRCDLLRSLELSWTVAGRWLVVATHSRTVRRLVEARRGGDSLLPMDDLEEVIGGVVDGGGEPRRVLFAQPRLGAAMIDTWIQHVSRHHPEMLQPEWWDRILRRQRAMGKQIGILARADGGTVEVVDALPGGPSRDRLLPGDRILAVDGLKIDPDDPLKSLREYVAQRQQPEKVTLLVRRADVQTSVDLVLPSDDPVQGPLRSPVELLKRFATVCRLFGSASYVLWQPEPDVVGARIDFRYVAASRPAAQVAQPASRRASSASPTSRASTTQPAGQPGGATSRSAPPATQTAAGPHTGPAKP